MKTENKPRVRINFTNGLTFQDSAKDLLGDIVNEYELVHDIDNPDVVVFGPYGNDIPTGSAIKVGYYCENIIPDMKVCDYSFGVPYDREFNNPQYCRIDFQGFDPSKLIKSEGFAEEARKHHTRFCNFLFSNSVKYREDFFKALSVYKKVDAPGVSMNNMPPLSVNNGTGKWEAKRNYIRMYKFTVTFENYSYPGYHSEKILDPMMMGSMPIYFGNPEIGNHFNSESFIDVRHFVKDGRDAFTLFIEKYSQQDFRDWRPRIYNSYFDELKRKLKIWGREYKLQREFRHGFNELIQEIIRLDKDENAYYDKLQKPWLINNTPPDRSPFLNRWRQILNEGVQKSNALRS